MKNKFRFLFILLIILLPLSAFSAEKKSDKKKNENETEALFSSYPEEWSTCLIEVLRETEKHNYINALNIFLSDSYNIFEFNKEKFSHSNDSDAKTLNNQTKSIKEEISNLITLEQNIESTKFSYSLASNADELNKSLGEIIKSYNKIFSASEEIKKLGKDSYIQFLNRTISGLSTNANTGLLGTIGHQIDWLCNSLMQKIESNYDGELKNTISYFESSTIFTQKQKADSQIAALKKIKQEQINLARINSFYNELKIPANSERKKNAGDREKSFNAFSHLCDVSIEICSSINSILSLFENAAAKPKNITESARNNVTTYSESLINQAKELSRYSRISTSAKKNSNLFDLQKVSDSYFKREDFTRAFSRLCAFTEQYATTQSIECWIKTASYFAEASDLLYTEDLKSFNSLEGYLKEDNQFIYAQRCINEATDLSNLITNDMKLVTGYKEKLNEGYVYRANFNVELQQLSAAVTRMNSLNAKFSELINNARSKLILSQSAKNEIDKFLNDGLFYHNKNDFDNSFRALQRAQSTYIEKIDDLKNDKDIQDKTFADINSFRQKIIDKEKPVFLSEIRNYKNEARISYYAGNFDQANAVLIQIENKRQMWSKLMDIELETDSEFERLKDFITTALAIKEGREISPYDSKAPEMKQNLSLANYYFDEGKKYTENNEKEKAKKQLNLAKEKINQVKIYYPRSREASLLSLKIDQYVDKETFDQTIKAKVEVLSHINYKERNALAQASYIDLLDLYELIPDYKGLKEIIDKAEIQLQIKPPPTNDNSIIKSKELAKEAQRLLNNAGRDEILLQQAKLTAEKALAENSSNTQALMILDEISLRTGSQTAVVLSPEDETLYQQALKDLQSNRVIEASVKLKKLLEKKSNSASAKILKLKKRIEAQL